MDHDGVLDLGSKNNITSLAPCPLDLELNEQPVRCTTLRGPAEASVPILNTTSSRWKAGVICVLRYFTPLVKDPDAPPSAEHAWPLPVKDQTDAGSESDPPLSVQEGDLCTTDDEDVEPEDRSCHWCSKDLLRDVHWSWRNAVCPQQRLTPVVMQMDSNHQPRSGTELPVTGHGSHMTLHEVLDYALFGPQDLDLTHLFGNFPLQAVVEPVPSAPGLNEVSRYHRAVFSNSLRRSARNQPVPSEPDLPDSVSPVVSTSGSDADSDSEWETMFQPEPATTTTAAPRDHHIQAWIAIHASRKRPRPAVGRPLSKSGNIEKATTIHALSNTVPLEPVDSKWLQGLSRFGPPPDDPCVIPNTFDQIDPVTPPWL